MRFVLVGLAALLSTALAAEGQTVYERFLVPLYGAPVAGAYGSRWGVETWVYYSGAEDTEIVPRLDVCMLTCHPFYALPAGEAPVRLEPAYTGSSLLLHVDQRLAAAFHFASRVRDLSRGDGSGTEIPVVHESRFSGAPLHLLNVPIRQGSRNTLRVYALPEVADPAVEIRYFRMPRQELDRTPDLRRVDRIGLRTQPGVDGFLVRPSIATLDFQIAELQSGDAAWLEIVPLTPGLRIWAMVSVTDNATQHVTLITPASR